MIEYASYTILYLRNGKKRVRYLVLKAIITGLQIINMLIWFWYILLGFWCLPDTIKEDWDYSFPWVFSVFATMIGAFILTRSCFMHPFNAASIILGILSFVVLIYILWGILLSIGIGIFHSSDAVHFPLMRLYLIFIVFWAIIKVIA